MNFANRRRLVIAIICGAVVLVVLVIIGVFGLLRGPADTGQAETPAPTASTSPATPEPTAVPETSLVSSDPDEFARMVALALFNWDTQADADLTDWAQVLVDVADVDQGPAVASDVRAYLPAPEIWDRLRSYGTRQWLDIKSITVPKAWATALEQAEPGQIPPGGGAFTVDGTRNRTGIYDSEVMRTNHEVAFTIFVNCPGDEPCTLRRLSRVDEPLR